MKKLLFPVFALVLLSSCGGNKVEEGAEKDTVDTVVDSVAFLPVDKEDSIMAQTKVPKAADGVFYDFISSFCQNSSYQKSRIKFPLECDFNGQKRVIKAKDWHFSKLYYNSDMYTVFFPDIDAMKLETDESVDNVNVLWYNTTSSTVSSYSFEKQDGQWWLMRIDERDITDDEDNGFINFYAHFAADDNFRATHLAETLIYDGVDPQSEDEFEDNMVKEKRIPSSHWSETLIPELSCEQFSNIDFGQDLSGSERVVSVESPSAGFSSRLHFRKEADGWQLYKIENL